MKKFSFVAAMAIAAVAMTSCGGASTPKENLKSDIDTLSYAAGVTVCTNYFNPQQAFAQMGVDSAYVDEFVRGLNEAAQAGEDKKKAAYMFGMQVGQWINKQVVPGFGQQLFEGDTTKVIDLNNFLAAFVAVVKGQQTKFTAQEADSLQEAYHQKVVDATIAEGKACLAEIAKNDSVQTTESGLMYKVLKQGEGAVPTKDDQVKVHYTGRLVDGTVFDSSVERGEPATFGVSNVIKGWTEALTMMPVGSKWEVYIPQELGYGLNAPRGSQIKPGSALIFTVELLEIVKDEKKK